MKRRKEESGDGFEAWGGYMNAKITKLEEQFKEEACEFKKLSNIFEGVAIFVNGHSEPSSEVLRRLMLQHGGIFHDYQVSATTHVIAANLPNAKLQQQAFARVLRPEWIVDSIASGKLLPIAPYLLCARSKLQPTLPFQPIVEGGSKMAKTAADASFINEFYNNSRLHHLSTMGALLKQYVGKVRETHSGQFTGLERLRSLMSTETKHFTLAKGERIIMHIDMDSFFVSVALREREDLIGRPVAVTHARGNPTHSRPGADPAAERAMYEARAGVSHQVFESKRGSSSETNESMSEVASCSYEARALGVKNGMYLGRALSLCPGLVTVPYDFAAYTEVSYALYDTVAEYTLDVEAVSCDELYVDCTAALRSTGASPHIFTKSLRSDVNSRTRCPCSAGLGANKLQARLASKKAKPNGQYHVITNEIDTFMRDILVKDLPGVGWSTTRKLQQMDIENCMDLQNLPLATLKSELGNKNGDTLFKFCRGIDDRPIVTDHQRKSVSAEVNYGIRFNNSAEADDFLRRLSGEVSDRLAGLSLRGRCITLKLMVRSADAPVETAKFLGHGVCDVASRSILLPHSTSDASTIADAVIKLNNQMAVSPEDMRGVGIQMTKLDGNTKSGTLQSFLAKHTKKYEKTHLPKPEVVTLPNPVIAGPSNDGFMKKPKVKSKNIFKKTKAPISEPQLPPISELDPEVVSALPEDIRKELLAQYGTSSLPCIVPGTVDNLDQSSCDSWVNQPVTTNVTNLREIKSNKNSKNLFSNLPFNELRDLVEVWVESESEPQRFDVEMLATHLADFATNRRIDNLDIVIRCLWRCIKNNRSNNIEWTTAYNFVVDKVQESMVNIYKYPLQVFQL